MDKAKAGYTEGLVSVLTNTGLFFLKLWAGIVTGSIALTADAWHTLSDSISSLIVILGVKLSSRKPDKQHPYGHGRWEQIVAIFIGFFLGIIAFDFFRDSIKSFEGKESVDFGVIGIVVTVISIIVKEGLAQYAFYIGRKTDNISIKADGWHHRTDALSSIVVLIGILFASKFWWIDAVLGLIIALMLFYATFEIIKESINKLLGEEPDSEIIQEVIEIIKQMYSEDLKAHHFHIHNYISSQELTFHIKLNKEMDIESGHKIATDIENRIKELMNIDATVHYEPIDYIHTSD